MRKLIELLLKFIKYFVCKWFGTTVLEKIVIILLEELVRRTENQLDNRIYEAIFTGKRERGKDV
jgi:membrane protein DedA with SNARE-associated domain